MIIQDNLPVPSFTYPPNVKRLVFCDFDETYLPFNHEAKNQSGINELEKLIEEHNHSLALLIGWVTGSSLSAVLRKSAGYITRLPHFIASSLGTELYWVKGNKLYESPEWVERINRTGFEKETIQKIVALLKKEGIALTRQSPDYQGKYTESYYYPVSEDLTSHVATIQNTATQFNCKALLTKCNPAAGDPPNFYDVQFLPVCCGKEQVLHFLSAQCNITHENTWAFGDSFNDIALLHSAGNAFL